MGAIASQITTFAIVCSTVYSEADQRKHQSSASLAFVWGIHWWPVNSPHKWPVTRKMFPFDDVIMSQQTPYGRILDINSCDFNPWWYVLVVTQTHYFIDKIYRQRFINFVMTFH